MGKGWPLTIASWIALWNVEGCLQPQLLCPTEIAYSQRSWSEFYILRLAALIVFGKRGAGKGTLPCPRYRYAIIIPAVSRGWHILNYTFFNEKVEEFRIFHDWESLEFVLLLIFSWIKDIMNRNIWGCTIPSDDPHCFASYITMKIEQSNHPIMPSDPFWGIDGQQTFNSMKQNV